jgi:hypothetical protein
VNQQPSVPRHLIDGDEHLAPIEIWKVSDEIVEGAGTTFPQHFDHSRFCHCHVDGHHGAPPEGVK